MQTIFDTGNFGVWPIASDHVALIEAAPETQDQRDELLAACKAALNEIGTADWFTVECANRAIRDAHGLLEAAIAKAEELIQQ